MRFFLKILFIRPIQFLFENYLKCYHILLFKYNQVEYKKFPIIIGKIIIGNKGRILIGKNVKFNNSITSNFVGLNKPCTIRVMKEASLIIGNDSGFSGISIFCSTNIIIGKYVKCGGNVCIWDSDFHPLGFKDRRTNDNSKILSARISIGDDVFIGANSIILKGVDIGDRSIIGAGSVVTKSIPSDEIWAGNPAKFIRKCID